DLLKIELDRRISTEDRDQHLELLLVQVDLFDLAGEFRERSGDDANDLVLLELDDGNGSMALQRLENIGDLPRLKGNGLAAGRYETDYARRGFHQVPGRIV